ncbi:amphi-Trp domain-containing protein [Natronomonas sp.]|uniref:amphi-Trp domain-containing protein n=1 Tax=Natronomonas sp. TaxID=2184060 RepID=UPI00398A28EC
MDGRRPNDDPDETEEEYRLLTESTDTLLIELGEQFRDGEELTITADEWELPFAFGTPVELKIDFDGVGEPDLEIEIQPPGRSDESAPTVE